MNLSDLNDYDKNWVGQSPDTILFFVKQNGGWKAVFPGELPFWAHRVRNFFNQEPMTLTRLDAEVTRDFLARVQTGLNTLNREKQRRHDKWRSKAERPRSPSLMDDIAETLALSGDVYKDELDRIWYQMDSGSTVYHFGPPPTSATSKSILYARAQSWTPVFKLMHPDGSGGSMETIIHNPFDLKKPRVMETGPGRPSIGEVNRQESVAGRIVTEPWHQGSYNYSETVEVGFAAHDRHDIKPDNRHPTAHVNPPNRHLLLALRKFPKL